MNNKDIHKTRIKILEAKLDLAEKKNKERELKWQILKTSLPFKPRIKFNKFIVVLCIVAIILYTIAAILLQKNIAMEISPTLTTCVYTFFGSELIGMAGIKIFDTKYKVQDVPTSSEINIIESENEIDNEITSDENEAVG